MNSNLYLIIGSILVGGVLLIMLFRYLARPRPCKVCGTLTKEHYDLSKGGMGSKFELLCRSHLAERWKKDFLASHVNMAVIEPDFESAPYGFRYASPDRLIEWQYPKEAAQRISEALASIPGKTCAVCALPATVAFYKKEQYYFYGWFIIRKT